MPYLFGALWVLILFGFMAAFFPKTSGVELGYGIVAALIFSGYILVDTQLVMRHYHVVSVQASLLLSMTNAKVLYRRRKSPLPSAFTSTSSTCSLPSCAS